MGDAQLASTVVPCVCLPAFDRHVVHCVCVFFRVPLQVTDVVELHAKKGRNLHLSYLDLLCKAAARVGTLVDLSA